MNSAIFQALADPIRQEILLRLAKNGPQTTLVLLEGLGGTRQGATRHLVVLENCDLVRSTKVGREVVRELNPQAIGSATTWLANLEAIWDRRLARLKAQYDSDL